MAYRPLGQSTASRPKRYFPQFQPPVHRWHKVRQGGRSRPGEAGMRRLKWAAVTTTVAALGIAARLHAGTLDQQQTIYTGSVDLGLNGPDRVAAQTFAAGLTAGSTGSICPSVTRRLRTFGPAVQIRTVANGLPPGTVLASCAPPPAPRSMMRWGRDGFRLRRVCLARPGEGRQCIRNCPFGAGGR